MPIKYKLLFLNIGTDSVPHFSNRYFHGDTIKIRHQSCQNSLKTLRLLVNYNNTIYCLSVEAVECRLWFVR
jgi:hypothetical protein